MQRVPIADYAATTSWRGIQNKPALLDGLAALSGQSPGYVYWNGSTIVSTSIQGADPGTEISGATAPATAVKRKPIGNPTGPFETVWARYQCNIKEFGATGIGITDDTLALNAAIAAVNSAGGGSIYIPSGTYSVTYLDLIQVPCVVYGDGIGSSIIRCNSNDGLAFYGPYLACVAGVSIEGSSTGITAEGSMLHMDRCSIEASVRGVDMTGVTSGGLSNSFFASLGTSAVGVFGSAYDTSFNSLRFMLGTSWAYGMYVSVGTSLTIQDVYANGVAQNAVYVGTGVSNSRITNIAGANALGASMVLDEGTNNFIDGLFGLGGNTDTRWDARKELFRRITWAPGGIPIGYGFYEDFTLEGAAMGDQVVFGLLTDPGVTTLAEGRIIANDQCRISVINIGTADIFIGTSLWSLRAYN